MKRVDLSHCFGCGADNLAGLHLKKMYVGDKARIEYQVKPEHTGFPGLMHGGITCVLFDDLMYHAVAKNDIIAVMANMTVDYRSPALVGDFLVGEAEVVNHEGRKIEVAGTIINGKTNVTVAEGKGLLIEVDLDKLMSKNNNSQSK